MLLYLYGHLHPEIAYAVNFADRYIFSKNHSNELSLKIIVEGERGYRLHAKSIAKN